MYSGPLLDNRYDIRFNIFPDRCRYAECDGESRTVPESIGNYEK